MKRWLALWPTLTLIACSSSDSAAPAQPPVISVETLFGEAKLNPTGNTPLAGEIIFRPSGDMVVEIAVAAQTADEAPFRTQVTVSGSAKEVALPLLCLFPAQDNTVKLTVHSADQKEIGTHTVTLKTGPLPSDFPTISATGTHDESLFTFVEWLRTPLSRGEATGIVVDSRGRVRWYSAFPVPKLHPMEIIGGTLYGGDQEELLLRYDFVGHELSHVDLTPHGYTGIHHDIFAKADGNLLLTVSRSGEPYIEDRVIEIDPSNNLRARWNLADTLPDVAGLFLDVPMTSTQEPGVTNNPIHSNALWYDDRDDTLLACSQRSGIAKLYRSGQLKWFLAPHLLRYIDDANGDGVSDSLVDGYDPNVKTTWLSDFRGPAFVNDRYPVNGKPSIDYSGFLFNYGEFLLTPLDASGNPIVDKDVVQGLADHPEFAWPFRPHAPMFLKNGNLLVFDNGLGRNFGLPFGPQAYSRAVEYEITPDTTDGYGGTVRQVWEYRLEADPSWYGMSVLVSDVDELESGARLITSGALGSSYMRGTMLGDYGNGPTGAVVIEVDPKTKTELHRLKFDRFIDTDHPPPEFSIYRAERFDPYQYWRGRTLGSP